VNRRVLGRLGPILLLAVLLVPAAATQAASPNAEPPGASSPIAGTQLPGAESKRRIALGMSMDPNRFDTSSASIEGIKTKTGRYPALWSVWSTWGDDNTSLFPLRGTFKTYLLAHPNITPVIVWQPTDGGSPPSPAYRNTQVIAGKFDGYITKWAKAAKAYGRPIILRFAQEANGSWNPWGPGAFTNTAETYIKMWKHVYKIFHKADVAATNVKFLWSPYQPCGSADCVPYSAIWVGDKFADYIGYSSFNWHTKDGSGHMRPCISMVAAYKTAYKKITALSHKPIIVAESASNRVGCDQAAWIANGYPAAYTAYPQIAAIMYFDIDMTKSGDPQQANWTLTKDAFAAYKQVLTSKHFQGTLP
jgi:hypothetical protein